jgi:hypothetical protein
VALVGMVRFGPYRDFIPSQSWHEDLGLGRDEFEPEDDGT